MRMICGAVAAVALFSAGPVFGEPLPADELAFISIVQKASGDYQNAPNDMLRGRIRADRASALCSLFGASPSYFGRAIEVHGWRGSISRLDSVEGKGSLWVLISPNVTLRSSRSEFSEGAGTLIDPAGPLFAAVSRMAVGITIQFDGKLQRSKQDCFDDTRFMESSAIYRPEFLFEFSAVAPAAP
jgi:hypothetical protein